MSYSKTWHRDYAAESIKRHEQQFAERAAMIFAEFVVECGQGAALAKQVGEECGNAKIADIAKTVLETIDEVSKGGTRRTRSYRKITSAQKYALAVTLLERYETARAIGAAIWGLTDAEIEGADA